MTTNSEEYNGWTNYQTWAVALWIDNDEGSQNYWAEQAQECWNNATANEFSARDRVAVHKLAELLKDEHEEGMPETDGVYADLLTSALGRVDWYEIATNMIEEVDKS